MMLLDRTDFVPAGKQKWTVFWWMRENHEREEWDFGRKNRVFKFTKSSR